MYAELSIQSLTVFLEAYYWLSTNRRPLTVARRLSRRPSSVVGCVCVGLNFDPQPNPTYVRARVCMRSVGHSLGLSVGVGRTHNKHKQTDKPKVARAN